MEIWEPDNSRQPKADESALPALTKADLRRKFTDDRKVGQTRLLFSSLLLMQRAFALASVFLRRGNEFPDFGLSSAQDPARSNSRFRRDQDRPSRGLTLQALSLRVFADAELTSRRGTPNVALQTKSARPDIASLIAPGSWRNDEKVRTFFLGSGYIDFGLAS